MADWQISGFDEVRELGRGAQGRVVLARHAERGTPVAIKYLPADADPRAQQQFRHEAQMLGQVQNPHVARLYQLVEGEHGTAIVMEAVNGVPFKEILTHHAPLQPEAALTVLKGSLQGLAAAHAAGVVHRDYKPANVVVPPDGQSKLIDFGIATTAGAAATAGTPVYMAPEQWRGQPAGPATDVYAATCVFYEAVTGHRPYPADNTAAIMNGHLNAPVPAGNAPEPVRSLIARGMAKDPYERPVTAAAFIEDLEQAARAAYGPDWESRGIRTLAGTAVALAALFPLAAAGLAPAGVAAGTAVSAAGTAGGTAGAAGAAGGGTAAGSSGVLATLGTKAGVAIAGTALVGASAGGYGIYRATGSEATPRTQPTIRLTPMAFDTFRIAVPAGWKATRLQEGSGSAGTSFRVDVSGKCPSPSSPTDNSAKFAYTLKCPSFAVLGASRINPPEGRPGGFRLPGPYHSAGDITHVCPPDPVRYNGITEPTTLLAQRLAPVGSHMAEYREWRRTCKDYTNKYPGTVSFVQRLWYLPDSKILIVDEWNTPGLADVLKKATWKT